MLEIRFRQRIPLDISVSTLTEKISSHVHERIVQHGGERNSFLFLILLLSLAMILVNELLALKGLYSEGRPAGTNLSGEKECVAFREIKSKRSL